VDHQPIGPDKGQQLVDDSAKARLAREKFSGNAVHRERILGHAALGIDVPMELPTGWNMMHEFDTGDFDDPVTFRGV
jgi:hypothetical protein